jgi:cobalamin transport system ATP-binding protein
MEKPDKILKVENLKIGYSSKKNTDNILFENIRLSGSDGELIALVGKNGVGKSTLLRNIAGLQNPLNGEVKYYDKPVEAYNRSDFAKMLSFVSTEIINVNNLKVIDLVSLGRFPHTNWFGKLKSEDIIQSEKALQMVGMDGLREKNINEISDGERQRVMIARTLAQNTKFIVLDEPTAFLDLPNKYEIVHLLNRLSKEENKTILFSTHDLNIAIQEADKIWLMLDNEIFEGAPEDLILSEKFNRLFENSNLHFDKIKGDFKLKRKYKEKIGLFGEGASYNWTKKALERLNFTVENGNESIMNIKVEIKEDSYKWALNSNKKTKYFKSIYELSLFLKKQTKF